MAQVFALLLIVFAGWGQEESQPISKDERTTTAETSSRSSTEVSDDGEKACRVLNEGKHEVDLMELVYPKRMQELGAKIQAATAKDHEWWTEYTKKEARDGQQLPYHPKMGVSEEEYEEYVRLIDGAMLRPVAKVTLHVKKIGRAAYRVRGEGETVLFEDVVVDYEKMCVTTPYGKSGSPVCSVAGPEHTIRTLGPWAGCTWTYDEGDVDLVNITSFSLLIGRLSDSNRAFLYYKAGKAENGVLVARHRIFLCFDPKGDASE